MNLLLLDFHNTIVHEMEKPQRFGIFKNESKYRYRYWYRPIAYILLGLYIGIGLLSKIHYRSLPDINISHTYNFLTTFESY